MEWLTWTLIVVITLLGVHFLFLRKMNKLLKFGILHKKPLPIFGNTFPMFLRRRSLVQLMDQIYRLNEDAQYVGFYDFSEPVIIIRSPKLMKNIAIKHFDHFVDHRAFVDPELEPLFGNNLIGLRGEKWRKMRNLLTPAFTSSKMKSMFVLMSNCAKNFIDHLTELSNDKPYVFDTKEAFTRYTTDVIATCAFGISVDSMRNPNNDFYVLGKKTNKVNLLQVIKFFAMRNFPRFSRFCNIKFLDPVVGSFFENVVKETIATRDRDGIVRPDMIQLMMEARGRKSDKSSELTIQEITAQALIFFFGGFETTSILMCFLAYEIATNPDVQKKLQEEIDKVSKATKGEPSYEALNECHYLDAVINETLRLFPPTPITDRLCVKTYELPPAFSGGKSVTIEPGQNLWFLAYSIHRDEKYFSNPDKFDPGRFIGNRKNEIDPAAFIPFGQGPRMCIGNRFALLETKVMIFHLLSKNNLKPSPKTLVPLELSPNTLNMIAKGGFWIQLESRNFCPTTSTF